MIYYNIIVPFLSWHDFNSQSVKKARWLDLNFNWSGSQIKHEQFSFGRKPLITSSVIYCYSTNILTSYYGKHYSIHTEKDQLNIYFSKWNVFHQHHSVNAEINAHTDSALTNPIRYTIRIRVSLRGEIRNTKKYLLRMVFQYRDRIIIINAPLGLCL